MADNGRLMGWSSSTEEPKRLNRYEILLEDDLRLSCRQLSIPAITMDQADIHRMHTVYKVAASKQTYGDITAVFYDFIDNGAGRALDKWHTQIYDINTSLMGFPADYKRDLTLLMYGPDHSVVETWLLVGAWPKNITRPNLDWSSANGLMEVTLTLAVDEAKLILS